MNQRDTIAAAVEALGPVDPETAAPFWVSVHEVLQATLHIKNWELEEGDASECECPQCVATVRMAEAILKEQQL